ncbi:DUF3341 domain-containing protein [Azospirillum sp. ST 5-10]|uniref:DUF3341 domain-containing protein n=1 Tax=unclassified Azospirillum TaxID=2630922 RepID=UPI003F49CF10
MAEAAGHAAPWGLLAEFRDPESLVAAAARLRRDGYRAIDAFTPFPVEELAEPLSLPRRPLGTVTAAGGVLGVAAGLAVQWYANAVDYPLDVGGRPLAAWTAFALPALEVGVAGGTLAALLALLVLCRLPRYHHPLFEVERFSRAAGSGFLLAVEARDARYDGTATRALLQRLGAVWVGEVPR